MVLGLSQWLSFPRTCDRRTQLAGSPRYITSHSPSPVPAPTLSPAHSLVLSSFWFKSLGFIEYKLTGLMWPSISNSAGNCLLLACLLIKGTRAKSKGEGAVTPINFPLDSPTYLPTQPGSLAHWIYIFPTTQINI